MRNKEEIYTILQDLLVGTELYIVEITVRAGSCIDVYLDSDTGVRLEDCIKISKQLEEKLDREAEDFELNVSSAGLDLPLRHIRQYQKNIGNELELVLKDGKKLKGKLTEVSSTGINLEYSRMEKAEGAKRKKAVTLNEIFNFENIKSAKVLLSF